MPKPSRSTVNSGTSSASSVPMVAACTNGKCAMSRKLSSMRPAPTRARDRASSWSCRNPSASASGGRAARSPAARGREEHQAAGLGEPGRRGRTRRAAGCGRCRRGRGSRCTRRRRRSTSRGSRTAACRPSTVPADSGASRCGHRSANAARRVDRRSAPSGRRTSTQVSPSSHTCTGSRPISSLRGDRRATRVGAQDRCCASVDGAITTVASTSSASSAASSVVERARAATPCRTGRARSRRHR